jgi:ABC-type polysaccharide/polyol phosphate export permease
LKTKNRHNDREPAHVPHDVPRGVMFPIQQMPWFMQDLSKLIPLTYAADAMRKIMLLNASLADVSTDTYISGLSVFLLWLLHYHCSGDQ